MMVLFSLLGCLAGLFVGALPGLSVTMATAILLSMTYTWQTSNALAMIMGVYVVGVFAGALSAILLNIPGAPSSVITTLDGYPMAERGEAGRAIRIAAVYSVMGSLVGFLFLWLLAKPMTALALRFTPMDYFLLSLFGLLSIGSLTAEDPVKGWISAVVGLLFSLVGMDSIAGFPRLTFGIKALRSGIPTVAALIGLFGFSHVIAAFADSRGNAEKRVDAANKACEAEEKRKKQENRKGMDVLRHWKLGLASSVIGTGIGALPGAGGPVASLTAYGLAKRFVKKPERPFGQGAEEGIIASEAANNGVVGGALIPTLTLGIPGDAVTAILLSVFLIHGLTPGPLFLQNSGEAFRAILISGTVSSLFLLPLGLFVAPKMAVVLNLPKRGLNVLISLLCIWGAFRADRRPSDILIMLAFGVLGYILNRYGFPSAPITLGLVLGKLMDTNFRRAISLAAAEDSKLVFLFGKPITFVLLALNVVFLVTRLPFFRRHADHEK